MKDKVIWSGVGADETPRARDADVWMAEDALMRPATAGDPEGWRYRWKGTRQWELLPTESV
jgi:hypothetical protein